MGRRSIKKDKNIYQLKREEVGLTREQASQELFVSPDTIERIENQNQLPKPDLLLDMATLYREPALCNYYCVKECAIGRKYTPKLTDKSLSQIVLEMKLVMDDIIEEQTTLEKIAVDNCVKDDEIKEFVKIQNDFNKMAVIINNLQFWSEEMVAEGNITQDLYLKEINKLSV